jgi:RNA polymerase sigma factor (sigma-70 family)
MDPALQSLSPKERQAVELSAQELSVEQIGQQMQVSPYAVRVFLENARVKLDDDL